MSARTTPRRRTAVFATAALATVVTGALVACGNSTASAADAPARSSRPSATATAGSSLHMISNNGHKLAFHVTPGHLPAIVLDAGGGLDSSQWQKIAPALARKTGSEIITYDRSGIGQSDEVVGAWNPQNAASDLEAGLTKLGATHDVVLVSHSQAGEVATYFAKKHPKWVSGAVLVDASLPNFYTDSETARIEAANQAQVAQLDGQVSTKEIRQLLATADNYGPMHHAYHQISWPQSVPTTVIASAKTPFDTPADAQLWRDAQTRFAKAAANRSLVVAKGSSHDIPADRPDVVIKAVEAMAKAHG
ncbi:alpha/beta fold hydrolase [Streptomyces sp. NBC_00932]|uniref:alpha/beta fold hydrolase n=1 Tax=Streptomyces sp. NBC_00932 TaxID=2903690 RepID=UPI00386D0B0C|nr:alpha/beta hydrolase [Streptomyces sp. NBC_00932]